MLFALRARPLAGAAGWGGGDSLRQVSVIDIIYITLWSRSALIPQSVLTYVTSESVRGNVSNVSGVIFFFCLKERCVCRGRESQAEEG